MSLHFLNIMNIEKKSLGHLGDTEKWASDRKRFHHVVSG